MPPKTRSDVASQEQEPTEVPVTVTGNISAETMLQALAAQQEAQNQALMQFMQQQTQALQAHRDASDAIMAGVQTRVQTQFQDAMQAQRDTQRAESLATEARLDAIRAEIAAANNAQQTHADAQTAALAAQSAAQTVAMQAQADAINASADAVRAGQGTLDATAAAAKTATNALATQAAVPRAAGSSGVQPSPPSITDVKAMDTTVSDTREPFKSLEQALRLRAKAYSLLLASHARNKCLALSVGVTGPPDYRFPNTAEREQYAAAVHDYIKPLGAQMFAVNATGARWLCLPPDVTYYTEENANYFFSLVADVLEASPTRPTPISSPSSETCSPTGTPTSPLWRGRASTFPAGSRAPRPSSPAPVMR